jgi:hypothetical protein
VTNGMLTRVGSQSGANTKIRIRFTRDLLE